jgi:molybdopterin-biosynthesis enzyme MoeA-like protein
MTTPLEFGLIVIGDEILSGKRADKHMSKVIELLGARGLQLAWCDYVGDEPTRITATLARGFERAAAGAVVFSTGGIGATPDDHTRQCAARALGRELILHPQAEALIRERMQDTAKAQGTVYEPNHPDNIHRLNMGVFPVGASIIPNPYNKIPGFACAAQAGVAYGAGAVHFVPGFPVMAWPMVEWVLDTHCSAAFQRAAWLEKSIIAYGSMEALLTPLMVELEARFAGLKVFSLPSVDHPVHGRHIELGVKGEPSLVNAAYPAMLEGLHRLGQKLGPELVRGDGV